MVGIVLVVQQVAPIENLLVRLIRLRYMVRQLIMHIGRKMLYMSVHVMAVVQLLVMMVTGVIIVLLTMFVHVAVGVYIMKIGCVMIADTATVGVQQSVVHVVTFVQVVAQDITLVIVAMHQYLIMDFAEIVREVFVVTVGFVITMKSSVHIFIVESVLLFVIGVVRYLAVVVD